MIYNKKLIMKNYQENIFKIKLKNYNKKLMN